jgi:hypothetical protein
MLGHVLPCQELCSGLTLSQLDLISACSVCMQSSLKANVLYCDSRYDRKYRHMHLCLLLLLLALTILLRKQYANYRYCPMHRQCKLSSSVPYCVCCVHVYPSLYVIAMLPLSLLLLISLKLESAYHHYFVDPAAD